MLPIHGARERGRQSRDHAELDRLFCGWVAFVAAKIGGIEDGREGPCADRDVGEHGVQRVAQPGAVQEVLHRRTLRHLLHGLLEEGGNLVADLIEGFVSGDRLDEALQRIHGAIVGFIAFRSGWSRPARGIGFIATRVTRRATVR